MVIRSRLACYATSHDAYVFQYFSHVGRITIRIRIGRNDVRKETLQIRSNGKAFCTKGNKDLQKNFSSKQRIAIYQRYNKRIDSSAYQEQITNMH